MGKKLGLQSSSIFVGIYGISQEKADVIKSKFNIKENKDLDVLINTFIKESVNSGDLNKFIEDLYYSEEHDRKRQN